MSILSNGHVPCHYSLTLQPLVLIDNSYTDGRDGERLHAMITVTNEKPLSLVSIGINIKLSISISFI